MKNAVQNVAAYILAALAGVSFISGLSILSGGERYV